MSEVRKIISLVDLDYAIDSSWNKSLGTSLILLRDDTSWPFRGLARQYVSSATHAYSVTCFQTFRHAKRNFSNRLVSQSWFLFILLHWNQDKKLFLDWMIVFMDVQTDQKKKIFCFFGHWCDSAPGFVLIDRPFRPVHSVWSKRKFWRCYQQRWQWAEWHQKLN